MLRMGALALLVALTSPATAQDAADVKPDIVGIYAVLNSYIETCVSKEDPPPLDKVLAVAHAATIAGLDITSAKFKRQAVERMKNLLWTVGLVGTRRWCEISRQTVQADYDRLTKSDASQ